jgi:hypothetical protein
MPESDIQKYEYMDQAQMGSAFFSGGIEEGAKYFVQLMRSYRISANVAHSAWKLVDEMEKLGTMHNTETLEELKQRLRLFAPEAPAFKQPKPVLEYGCRLLEELYDALSPYNDPAYNTGVILEQLFKRISAMRDELAK